MTPSCLASVSRAAEQASDCLLIYIEIPTANYLHRYISLLKVISY